MFGASVKSEQLTDSPSVADPFREQTDYANIDDVATIIERAESFFMGAGRRSVLDEVSHLCQFSNNLVVVLGEAGVGKSALVRQVTRELNDTALCCLVRSSITSTAFDVFQNIARQIGVFIAETASIDDIVSALSQYQPTVAQQRAVIVIDDAHHLPDDVLQGFIDLLQSQSIFNIHVLLMGDSSLLSRLDYLEKGGVLVYDIPLLPFDIAELESYLLFKLSEVGYQGVEVFDGDAVQSIWNETRGIASSVNRIAHQRLLAYQTEEPASLGLPMRYMMLLVVLLAALIMSLAYISEPIKENASLVDDTSLQQQINEPSLEKTLEAFSTEDQAESQAAIQMTPKVPSESKLPLPVVNQDDLGNITYPAEVKSVVEAPTLAPLPSGETETRVSTSPANDPRSAVEPEVLVAPKTALPSSKVRSGATQDEIAVLSWPSEKYTLQVIAASELSRVEKFVEQQPNRGLLHIVHFERNGGPWYVVFLGVYSSITEARNAIQILPEEQVKSKPWPRKIGDVHRKMEGFLSN